MILNVKCWDAVNIGMQVWLNKHAVWKCGSNFHSGSRENYVTNVKFKLTYLALPKIFYIFPMGS